MRLIMKAALALVADPPPCPEVAGGRGSYITPLREFSPPQKGLIPTPTSVTAVSVSAITASKQ